METKKIQKPFSIEEWKSGAKVETRDGLSVRILCADLKNGDYTIVAAIIRSDNTECVALYDGSGHFCKGYEGCADLVIVEEVEESKLAENMAAEGEGWYIDEDSKIHHAEYFLVNEEYNRNVFATEKQAKSALAMARISQLMAYDERYGGVVTDEEWRNNKMVKPVLYRSQGAIARKEPIGEYHFLAFHTEEQRKLFFAENERLVRDYLMID